MRQSRVAFPSSGLGEGARRRRSCKRRDPLANVSRITQLVWITVWLDAYRMASAPIDSSQGEVAAAVPVIDLVHLKNMTLGDVRLEREVLQLFERQSAMLIERMRAGAPADIASCAHLLKGSARGIGAWVLASAAEQLEDSAGRTAADCDAALARLIAATEDVRRAIAQRLA